MREAQMVDLLRKEFPDKDVRDIYELAWILQMADLLRKEFPDNDELAWLQKVTDLLMDELVHQIH